MLDAKAKTKHSSLFPDDTPSKSSSKSEESSSTEASSEAAEARTLPQGVRPFKLPDFAAPFIFIPPYLEVSFPTCTAVYVRHPTAGPGYSEVPTPYAADGEIVKLAWVS